MAESGEEIFIGRQPILGRDHELFAYELLFRNGRQRNSAEVEDDMQALKMWPLKLLAKKVDSRELADRCHALGYAIFKVTTSPSQASLPARSWGTRSSR